MSKCYASAVLAIAAAEIGYHEKKSNSQLDNPTANAGSANYTKYARDFDEKYPKWYNGKKNGFAWCDMFVDWCMLTAFGYADALRLLCQPERSAGAGCTYSLMYYEKQGRYHAKDPKPGDQIFFSTAHSKSNVSHTGLVEKVDGSKVYTIEGNTSDQVARRSYYLSDSYIVGYGRPAYDAEPGTPTRAARRRAAAAPAK
ncbi:MAG: CHAP domain-containing protein [Oscillibacter sp.]